MNYQKTYMNHIHSSSLLCQLATMWKSQTLCDAIIRTGSITTKAHRVVLVAACPMLQSMENAAAGSHLEVRLAADIKQDSINSFLQYLYEGFITLTEENCKDVEKIARLLQVENVIKCCADFHKCLNTSAGSQYKYTFSDQLEFRHMRTTDLSKVQERMSKRHMDSFRPSSPGAKRQRIIRPSSPPTDVSMHGASQKVHDTASMAESYMTGAPDPMDRVPRLGSGMHQSLGSSSHPSPSRQAASSQPGVVNIVEDSIELIQTEPPGKHPGEGHSQETRKVQSSVSISVASQHNAKTDLQIVNVTGSESASTSKTSSSSDTLPITIPGSPSSSSSSSFKESSNVSHVQERHTSTSQQNSLQQKTDSEKTSINLTDVPFTSESELMSGVRPRGPEPFSTSTPQRIPFPVSLSAVQRAPSQPYQSKQIPSYAAGSASQAESMTPPGGAGRGQRSQSLGSTGRSENVERGSPVSTQVKDTSVKTKPESSVDMTPDISIVKVEGGGNDPSLDYTGGLDMFVSEAGVTSQPRAGDDDDPNVSDFELEEPPGDMSRDEQMSNEGSNIGGDQSGNWYMGAFRDKRSTNIDPVTGSSRPRPGIWNHAEAAMYGMRELSPGTSVFLYEEDYNVALSKIKVSEKTHRRDGTPAARFLLSVFYTSAELVNATIRNDGDDASKGPGYVPLNKNIIYAIEAFCIFHSDSTTSHVRAALGSKITCIRTKKKYKVERKGRQLLQHFQILPR